MDQEELSFVSGCEAKRARKLHLAYLALLNKQEKLFRGDTPRKSPTLHVSHSLLLASCSPGIYSHPQIYLSGHFRLAIDWHYGYKSWQMQSASLLRHTNSRCPLTRYFTAFPRLVNVTSNYFFYIYVETQDCSGLEKDHLISVLRINHPIP